VGVLSFFLEGKKRRYLLMEHLSVPATLRGKQTHSALTHLRKSGQTPVSLSGRGMDPVSLMMSTNDIMRVLQSTSGRNTLLNVTVGEDNYVARLAQVNRHPISRQIIAVSLQKIAADELQKATIGLSVVGEPQIVRDLGALLSTFLDHLEVRALPEKMVDSLTVDASQLVLGDTLRAGDVILPDGFILLTDPQALVASVHSTASINAKRLAEQASEDKAAADARPTAPAAI